MEDRVSRISKSPLLVPVRQSNGSLKMVQVDDSVWSELTLFLKNNQQKAMVSFLPPERHLEPIVFSIAMATDTPLVCGSVYNLPWVVKGYIFSNATCIVSESDIFPYLLKALKKQTESKPPKHIILVTNDAEISFKSEEIDSKKTKVVFMTNPLLSHVSE